MATLKQENSSSVLDLNLSLGGLFSQLPYSHSQDFHQQKRARTPSYQEHTSSDDSSSHLSIASCSIPTHNPEHLSVRSDKDMKENDVHSSSKTPRMLSDHAKKPKVSDQVQSGSGSTSIIRRMLPTKRKTSFENEEGTICRSNSAESENGENPEEGRSTWKKALGLEAPWSRCSSNSDLLGSEDPVAEKLSHSSMMYMQYPSAMLPVQGPHSVPVQWGFNPPYPMQDSSHMLSPALSYFPWIAPFDPDSSSGLRTSVPAASCLEGKLKGAFSQEAALPAAPSSKNKVLQDVSRLRELPCTAVCTSMPMPESEVCPATSPLRPSCSVSPTANYPSDVCTSPRQPLMSATSLVTNCSYDSFKQVDPAKEESGLSASFSSPTREGCLKSALCPQKSHDASPHMFGQISKHSLPTGPKPTKTVRFFCDKKELDKSASTERKRLTSTSFTSRKQLIKKLQALGKEVLCNLLQRNGGVSNRTSEECEEEEESDDSRITSESSDQDESALLVKGGGGAGNLEAKIAASWPRVSTTCAGLNGKTIHGVMYITESKQACLICSCHGTHMTPSEFVQHSGSTDLRNPERSIVISGLSYVKQVV